jgi:DNA polymerase I-like protein with 3'-5' exonuclease and polymerase domains
MSDPVAVVLDLETSLHNDEVGKFKAHPMSTKNWIVWAGAVVLDDRLRKISNPELFKYTGGVSSLQAPPTNMLLVGHNIGFDILHACNTNNTFAREWREWLNNPDTLIWDTQIAEYRLSGQSLMSPALDQVCINRGWPVKPGKLKEYWAQGISTEDIPADEVEPYLEHDVHTTHRLFRAQIAEAEQRGMLDMLRIEMQSRLTTLVMELNGMHFERERALESRDAVIKPLRDASYEKALELGSAMLGLPKTAINPGSPMFLKAVLYGGTVKWREQHPMLDDNGNPLLFKSGSKKGQPRQKWHDYEHAIPGSGWSPITLANSDEEALGKIMEHSKCAPELRDFLQEVINFRDASKQERTYFTGYSELTWPDGMIHGNLNHAITATGRLSSTNPNLQNAGHSPIREHFTSRFEDGYLMEVDLSQIEVVVQAWLSQDEHMIRDIKHGVDFHSKRAAFAHGQLYEIVKQAVDDKTHPDHAKWTKIRKGAKIVSFQKAYGAGAKKISDTTGLSMKEVKAFMDAEDKNYPKVPETQERWIEEVKRSTKVRDGRTCGVLHTPIGVEYRFFQDDFNGHRDYKPTTIKNYPIQGFSADILKIILSGLREVVAEYNALYSPLGGKDVLLINTVHDSVIIDCPVWVQPKLLGGRLREYFTTHPVNVLKNTWGVDFNVPISADVDVGKDWRNMETIEVTQ